MSWSTISSFVSQNRPDWTLLAVRLYTYASSFFQIVFNQSVKSSKYLVDSFKDDVYMFMNGSFAPVPSRNYSLHKTGSSVPVGFYNRETKTLSRAYPGTSTNNHTLDIYTAQLYHGDMMIYDLTDFFETTFFAEQDTIPGLPIWLGAWSLENRIYLDPNVNYVVKFTTLENENNEFSIWSTSQSDSERWQRMNQSVPRLHRQAPTPASAPSPVQSEPEHPVTPPVQEETSNAAATVVPAPEPFDEEPASSNAPIPDIQSSTSIEQVVAEVQPANA